VDKIVKIDYFYPKIRPSGTYNLLSHYSVNKAEWIDFKLGNWAAPSHVAYELSQPSDFEARRLRFASSPTPSSPYAAVNHRWPIFLGRCSARLEWSTAACHVCAIIAPSSAVSSNPPLSRCFQ